MGKGLVNLYKDSTRWWGRKLAIALAVKAYSVVGFYLLFHRLALIDIPKTLEAPLTTLLSTFLSRVFKTILWIDLNSIRYIFN